MELASTTATTRHEEKGGTDLSRLRERESQQLVQDGRRPNRAPRGSGGAGVRRSVGAAAACAAGGPSARRQVGEGPSGNSEAGDGEPLGAAGRTLGLRRRGWRGKPRGYGGASMGRAPGVAAVGDRMGQAAGG